MAKESDLETVADILDLASKMIYFERMEWAIAELCLKINNLETRDQWYINLYDLFEREVKALITHLRNNPTSVEFNGAHTARISYLLDFIESEIRLDIGVDLFGVAGPTDVGH